MTFNTIFSSRKHWLISLLFNHVCTYIHTELILKPALDSHLRVKVFNCSLERQWNLYFLWIVYNRCQCQTTLTYLGQLHQLLWGWDHTLWLDLINQTISDVGVSIIKQLADDQPIQVLSVLQGRFRTIHGCRWDQCEQLRCCRKEKKKSHFSQLH